MKFKSDVIFSDFKYLFCDEFDPGYQLFSNWSEFIYKVTHHLNTDRPKYAYKATFETSNDDREPKVVHVDISEVVEIPWFELEKFV